MANGDFGRVDLLRRFKDEAGLAEASELDATSDIYPLLSDGQLETTRELAARCYKSLYGAPSAMTSTDGGYTWYFGASPVDATKKLLPLGWVQISPRLSSFIGDGFNGWVEGVDYLGEGDRIRIPGNRTYSGTLYARFVPTPPPITASVDAILRPPEINILTVYKAVEQWAGQGNVRPELVKRMQDKWARAFPIWCHTLKKQYRGGGAMVDPNRWYLNINVGSGSGFSA